MWIICSRLPIASTQLGTLHIDRGAVHQPLVLARCQPVEVALMSTFEDV